jgi:stage V sporulation protein B
VPIFLATGTICFLVMLFVTFWYTDLINSPNAKFACLALSPTVLFSCLMSIYRGYYQGLSNMIPTAISEIIEAISKVVFGLGFANLFMRISMSEFAAKGTVFGKICSSCEIAENEALPIAAMGAIFGITLGSFLGFLFLLIRHKKVGDGITSQDLAFSPIPMKAKHMIKSLVKIAVPIAFGALIMNLGGLVDTIIIRRQLYKIMNDFSQPLLKMYGDNIPQDKIVSQEVHSFISGCLGYVSSIVMLVPGVIQMLGISALPAVTKAWTLKNFLRLEKSIKIIIKITTIFVVPAGVGLFTFGHSILNLFYSNTRTSEVNIASGIMTTMSIATIFTAMSVSVCSMLQAIGKVKLTMLLICIGTVIKIIVNYILVGIPTINIKGAGIGSFFCYSFVFFCGLYFLFKECRINIKTSISIFLKPTCASVFSAFLCSTIYKNIEPILSKNNSTIFVLFSFVIIYISLLFFFGIINFQNLKKIKDKI